MITLGAALRAARERANLTTAEAARRSTEHGETISKQYLGELEADHYKTLSVARFAALCELYDASTDAILTECGLIHRGFEQRTDERLRRLEAASRLGGESLAAIVEMLAGIIDDDDDAIKDLRAVLTPRN